MRKYKDSSVEQNLLFMKNFGNVSDKKGVLVGKKDEEYRITS